MNQTREREWTYIGHTDDDCATYLAQAGTPEQDDGQQPVVSGDHNPGNPS